MACVRGFRRLRPWTPWDSSTTGLLPTVIRVYGLEEYAGLITPHWMEVNLYSRTRGVNRFKGLAATMRMLAEHGVRVPGADELCAWVEKAPKLSNPALEEAVAAGGGAGLQKALGMEPRRQRGHRRHGR